MFKKWANAIKVIGKAIVSIAEVVLAVLAVVAVFNGDKTAPATV